MHGPGGIAKLAIEADVLKELFDPFLAVIQACLGQRFAGELLA